MDETKFKVGESVGLFYRATVPSKRKLFRVGTVERLTKTQMFCRFDNSLQRYRADGTSFGSGWYSVGRYSESDLAQLKTEQKAQREQEKALTEEKDFRLSLAALFPAEFAPSIAQASQHGCYEVIFTLDEDGVRKLAAAVKK